MDPIQAPLASSSRPSVLVVDDEEDIRVLLEAWLSGQFTVITAADGIEAIAMLRNGVTFDVALLDVMMPKVDGFTVAKAIRELRPGTPVLMLSAISDLTNRERGTEAGVTSYLAKPFDPLQLRATLLALTRRTGRAELPSNPDSPPTRCAWRGCAAPDSDGALCIVHHRLLAATGQVDLTPALHARAVGLVVAQTRMSPDEASALVHRPGTAPSWETSGVVWEIVEEVLAEHAGTATAGLPQPTA